MSKIESRVADLVQALGWALEWIDAVPDDTAAALPAMPGFDRDYVNSLLDEARAEMAAPTAMEAPAANVPAQRVDRNAVLDEALAVVPGGSVCDPQQIADAIRALKKQSAAQPVAAAPAPHAQTIANYLVKHTNLSSTSAVKAAAELSVLFSQPSEQEVSADNKCAHGMDPAICGFCMYSGGTK